MRIPCALVVLACALAAGRASATPHVVLAGAASDTLSYTLDQVFPVAVEELEKNDWSIQRSDSGATSRRLVTKWKPIKHVLARVFLEGVLARCVVDFEPVSGGRTVVTIQGGLASEGDLESSPAFPAAQTTYRHAAERWLGRVHASLAALSARTPLDR